jgi:hypothetical protein
MIGAELSIKTLPKTVYFMPVNLYIVSHILSDKADYGG